MSALDLDPKKYTNRLLACRTDCIIENDLLLVPSAPATIWPPPIVDIFPVQHTRLPTNHLSLVTVVITNESEITYQLDELLCRLRTCPVWSRCCHRQWFRRPGRTVRPLPGRPCPLDRGPVATARLSADDQEPRPMSWSGKKTTTKESMFQFDCLVDGFTV